jgi:hypothetical protein
MEEETPALFILGWTPRGLDTASATAVLGPRPDSSMLWRRTSSSLPVALGRYLHGGVVVTIIVHLELGPSSTPNTRPLWAEPNKDTFTQIKCRAWVRVGLGRRNLVHATPETGDSKLAAASPWRQVRRLICFGVNFLNSSWRGGDDGKANCCSYRRRRSSVLIVHFAPCCNLRRRKLDT